MNKKCLFLATTVWTSLIFSISANANLLVNGSFEIPASAGIPSLPIGSTYLTGWTVINAEIAQEGPAFPTITASDGSYSLDLTGYHDSAPYGGVEQSISTVPLAIYNISFDVGAIQGTSAVQVSAGNLLDTSFSTSTGSGLVWTTYSSIFTAQGSTTQIDLIGTQSSWGGIYIGLDNVVVNLTSVPTPAAVWLFSSALLGFIRFNRRKTIQQ